MPAVAALLLIALLARLALGADAVATAAGSEGATGLPPPMALPDPTPAQLSNLGFGINNASGLTSGPDGNVWFVNLGNSSVSNGWISRSAPDGTITNLAPSAFALHGGIASGPDGNLWVTGEGTVARVTVGGAVTPFTDPGLVHPLGITAGPDGALWFTDSTRIGRVTTSGAFTFFESPDIAHPTVIVAGPDGNLWFNSTSGSTSVGRLTPNGVTSRFLLVTDRPVAALTPGPDGDVWFAGDSILGHISPAGVPITVPFTLGRPNALARGADDNVWVSFRTYNPPNTTTRHFARVTPAGVMTDFSMGDVSAVSAMAAGPGGAVWFTGAPNVVGSISPDGALTTTRRDWVDRPDDITTAPAGDLVFGNVDGGSIGRVSTNGVISHLVDSRPTDPDRNANPVGTSVAADGSIWFAGSNGLRQMTPDGKITYRSITPDTVRHLTTGPDGNIWVTSSFVYNPNQPPPPPATVERFTADGQAEAHTGADIVRPGPITTGPDGNLWFVTKETQLGRLSPGGATAAFPTGAPSTIQAIAAGPDGNLWFATAFEAMIRRMTPEGVTTAFATGDLVPTAITAGPDGNVWFTSGPSSASFTRDAIGRITPAGELSSVTDPTVAWPTSITAGPDGGLWFTNRGNNSIGRVALAPGAPTGVVATPGTDVARVAWSPGPSGGSPVTGYTVTAAPGGSTCVTTGAMACVVAGLTPGAAYTFTVTATNVIGSGPPSAPSVPVTVGRGGGYHPVTPVRILDSRTDNGSWSGTLAAGSPRDLQVTGRGGASSVPEGAAAAVMNVTVTGATENSFLKAWPTGSAPPGSSNLNFAAGETIPNLVTVQLGPSGKVSFANAVGAVHVVADLVGYYDDGTVDGDRFTAIAPVRLLDSRTETGGWDRPLVAGAPHDLLVRQPSNPAGVPATATAVVVNLTATEASAPSFVSARPSGSTAGVSNVNFAAGQTIANLAIVKIGADGAITLDNAAGAVEVIVDLVGYFDPTAGSRFHAIMPTRVLDDRVGTGLTGPWGPGLTRSLVVAGAPASPVPAGATGLIVNVTATGGTANSFVTVFPHGVPRPNSSSLNFAVGQTIPNLVMVGVGTAGTVDLFNAHGSVDLIGDAVGYFSIE